jgi:hypothetical protein
MKLADIWKLIKGSKITLVTEQNEKVADYNNHLYMEKEVVSINGNDKNQILVYIKAL